MSTTSIDPNEFLNSTGVPSAKFPTIGTVVKGRIEHLDVQQQRDFTTGEPKTYDDGKPAMQLVVTLATDERDPEISDDDGMRRLFAKGQLLAAIRTAVRQAGAQLSPGGTLAVQYTADKPSEKRGMNPAKVYVAQYKAGVASQGAVDDLLGSPTPAAAAPTTAPAASDLI